MGLRPQTNVRWVLQCCNVRSLGYEQREGVCVCEWERESSVTTLSRNRTHARALRAYQASMRWLVLACVFLSVIFFIVRALDSVRWEARTKERHSITNQVIKPRARCGTYTSEQKALGESGKVYFWFREWINGMRPVWKAAVAVGACYVWHGMSCYVFAQCGL